MFYKIVHPENGYIMAFGEGLGMTVDDIHSVPISDGEYSDIKSASENAKKSPDSARTGRFEELVIDGSIIRVPDESERGYHVSCRYYRHDLPDRPPEGEEEISDSEALNIIAGGKGNV